MHTRLLFLSLFILASCFTVSAQEILPYKNPQLPVEQRVQDLLNRMTTEEKYWQLFMAPGELDSTKPWQYKQGIFGLQVSASGRADNAQLLNYNTKEPAAALAKKINAIQKFFVEETRLGIPMIAFDEALHGLVREGATAFPQAIALAATWDTALMHRVAGVIAQECWQRGIRQVLSPVVNLATDVRWGRTEETYGEDPVLSSEMAVAFVRAFEQLGIITTPKHFIANVGDGGRDSYPINSNDRLLFEQYLVPFKACIDSGGSRSIMTAYNSYDGSPATASNYLLNNVLKKQLGFNGFVISDANAVGGANVLHYTAINYADAGQKAINNGLDVIFQTDYDHYELYFQSPLANKIAATRLNDAVARVLKAKFGLGLFEHPYIEEQKETFPSAYKKELAKEASVKSMVLLKNENNLLPFSARIKNIAVIGEDAVQGRLGGYSGPGNGVVTILEGIKQRAGKTINVHYAPGCGRTSAVTEVVPARYLTNLEARYTYNTIVPGDNTKMFWPIPQIDFHWTLNAPADGVNPNFFAARFTGWLSSPVTGKYLIGLEGNDGYRLYINDSLIVDRWQKITVSETLEEFYFEKNRKYKLRVDFYEPTGNGMIRLKWNAGMQNNDAQEITAAVAAAKRSDVAIVVAGINEGEFRDRASLHLPGRQEEMIRRIAATGKPVIVLLVGGSAVITNNWLDKAGAVLDVWYPGEAGGTAVAAVLFGDENPAGRLPISFPKHEGQLPLTYNHRPTGRGDDYNDMSGMPQFPFGFGLSYTQFEYSAPGKKVGNRFEQDTVLVALPGKFKNFNTHSINDTITVGCTVENTGTRAGDEVVQLYIRKRNSSVAQPVMELKGFQRIHLAPGAFEDVLFHITPGMLRTLNEKMEWVNEPGAVSIMIGASSKDIRIVRDIQLK